MLMAIGIVYLLGCLLAFVVVLAVVYKVIDLVLEIMDD